MVDHGLPVHGAGHILDLQHGRRHEPRALRADQAQGRPAVPEPAEAELLESDDPILLQAAVPGGVHPAAEGVRQLRGLDELLQPEQQQGGAHAADDRHRGVRGGEHLHLQDAADEPLPRDHPHRAGHPHPLPRALDRALHQRVHPKHPQALGQQGLQLLQDHAVHLHLPHAHRRQVPAHHPPAARPGPRPAAHLLQSALLQSSRLDPRDLRQSLRARLHARQGQLGRRQSGQQAQLQTLRLSAGQLGRVSRSGSLRSPRTP